MSVQLTSAKLMSVQLTSAMSNTTQRLEEIVACLKDDSLELDQALSLLEEAQKLADKACDEFEEQFRAPVALDGAAGEHAGVAATEVSADERFNTNDHACACTAESANDHAGGCTNEHTPKEVS